MSREWVAIAACMLLACASGPRPTPVEDEAFRAHPPVLPPLAEVEDPRPERMELPNGLRVVLFERHAYPVVAVQLVLNRGPADLEELGAKRFATTMYLFRRALEQHPAAMPWSGIRLNSSLSIDSLHWSAVGPSSALERSLDALVDVSFGARLDPDEYEHRQAQLERWTPPDDSLHHDVLIRVIFGNDHPYGRSSDGSGPVSLPDAEALHAALLQPSYATLVVVGDVTSLRLNAAVHRFFGTLTASGSPLAQRTEAPLSEPKPGVIVATSRAKHPRATIAARGPRPGTIDVLAISLLRRVVVERAMGRSDGGRGFERGLTPPIVAQTEGGRLGSITLLTARVTHEDPLAGIRTLLDVLEHIRSGEVSADEVNAAREAELRRWRGSLDTAEGASAWYAGLEGVNRDAESAGTYAARLATVRAVDLVRVANQYLARSRLYVVLTGDDPWQGADQLGLGSAERVDLTSLP